MSGHAPIHRSHCQNCGAPLSGPYCSRCGQHDFDYSRSFLHVAEEALEGLFHFDGKFFRSARYIFTRPGFLTREFNEGRRVRYANPLRFYIFASFLFFGVGALATRHGPPEKAALPGAQSGRAAGEADWFGNVIRVKTGPGESLDPNGILREFVHLIAEALFFCIPILALVLKLVYIRSGRPYIEHLVFALHLQGFVFLYALPLMAGRYLGGLAGPGAENAVATLLTLPLVWLIYRSFRTVYAEGPWVTALKVAFVGAAYGAVVVAGLLPILDASTYLASHGA